MEYFIIETVYDKINSYKQTIKLLDDCTFVDVLDELKSYEISLKKFDELLNKEDLTAEEMLYVSYLIEFANYIIKQHITKRIDDLTGLLDRI